MLTRFLTNLFAFCRALSVFAACLFFGQVITYFIPLHVPASIWGMVILFIALNLNIIKPKWIEQGVQFTLKYMLFLFIPVSVGVMNYFGLFKDNFLAIFLTTIGASFITLVILGLLFKFVLKEKS